MWKTIGLIAVGGGVLFLVGCSRALMSPAALNQSPVVYQHSGYLASCQRMLARAKSQLKMMKQKALTHHVTMNWDQRNGAIAGATAAKNHQDYTLCVTKAQQVNSYAQRDQSYIQWKGSLKPGG